MSLFGSLTTAISGLTSQSRALGHISDNVANSQTVGFKRVDTNFVNYLTQSTEKLHAPGTTIARPKYTNSVQGTLEQSEDPLALAIGGQGFFSVSQRLDSLNGSQPVFDERQLYTRAGDFRMNEDGFLVNGSGYYLQGWNANSLGVPDRTTMQAIRIDQQIFNPIATSTIEIDANLPADGVIGNVYTTQAQAYDALGERHLIGLNITRTAPDVWTFNVNSPDDVTLANRGAVQLRYGAAAVPPSAPGTLGELRGPTGTVAVVAPIGSGDPARLTFNTDFGQGPQTITIDVGEYNRAVGVTQYAGTELTVRNLVQDGVPLGAFAGVEAQDNGDIAVYYDNGQSRIVAKVPLVAFNDPEKLQRLDGQAFMRTVESGEARITDAQTNGVGKLVTGSIERSNVDIAAEFTKLIVAQRAYTANTRVVTTADEMLQDTINMRR